MSDHFSVTNGVRQEGILSPYLFMFAWIISVELVERSGSGVELRTLGYENPGSNPGCGVKTLGKFFHSTLPQFTQLNK